jgi:hypothetical protein
MGKKPKRHLRTRLDPARSSQSIAIAIIGGLAVELIVAVITHIG